MPRSLFAVAAAALVASATPASAAWPLGSYLYGSYLYAPSYPDPYPPSVYGYPLDDPHPGYYGGLRYREYYSYGRGYGYANFPGGLPGFPWAYPDRSLRLFPPAPPAAHEPPPTAVQPVAVLEVRVPDQAEVWIEGQPTKQTGPARTFVSPPLKPGDAYGYEIKARWKERGRDMEQTQSVTVQAGTRVSLTFPAPAPAEELPPPTEAPAKK